MELAGMANAALNLLLIFAAMCFCALWLMGMMIDEMGREWVEKCWSYRFLAATASISIIGVVVNVLVLAWAWLV